ncbi:MAG: hypothetical protein ACYCSF_09085 [Acidimicrobiales bacterium]
MRCETAALDWEFQLPSHGAAGRMITCPAGGGKVMLRSEEGRSLRFVALGARVGAGACR